MISEQKTSEATDCGRESQNTVVPGKVSDNIKLVLSWPPKNNILVLVLASSGQSTVVFVLDQCGAAVLVNYSRSS